MSTELQMLPPYQKIFPFYEHDYEVVLRMKPLLKTTFIFRKQTFKIAIYLVE